jgi:hypothetical protein
LATFSVDNSGIISELDDQEEFCEIEIQLMQSYLNKDDLHSNPMPKWKSEAQIPLNQELSWRCNSLDQLHLVAWPSLFPTQMRFLLGPQNTLDCQSGPKIQVSTTLNAFVKANNLLTKGGCLHCPNTKCLVHIITRDHPYIIWRIAHPMGSRWLKRNLLGAWRKSRSVKPIKLVCSASMQLPTGKSDREQLSNQSSRNLRKKMLSLTDQDHIDSGT